MEQLSEVAQQRLLQIHTVSEHDLETVFSSKAEYHLLLLVSGHFSQTESWAHSQHVVLHVQTTTTHQPNCVIKKGNTPFQHKTCISIKNFYSDGSYFCFTYP